MSTMRESEDKLSTRTAAYLIDLMVDFKATSTSF